MSLSRLLENKFHVNIFRFSEKNVASLKMYNRSFEDAGKPNILVLFRVSSDMQFRKCNFGACRIKRFIEILGIRQ
jgi:hypothetical protein